MDVHSATTEAAANPPPCSPKLYDDQHLLAHDRDRDHHQQSANMSRRGSLGGDVSEDEFLPPDVHSPRLRSPAAGSAGKDRRSASPERPPRAVTEPSVLDLTVRLHVRHVDGTVLSNNAAVRVVRLPHTVVTIGDDFAAGCPRLRTVDVSRCARLRSVGARFFAGSGAPLAGALALDLSGCGALRSIGAEFAADSEASVIVLPAGLARVGPGFAARPAGGTPLVDVSRCGAAVAQAIAAQRTTGDRTGPLVVRYAPRAPRRRQTLPQFLIGTCKALAAYVAAVAFKLLVTLAQVVFGTTFY